MSSRHIVHLVSYTLDSGLVRGAGVRSFVEGMINSHALDGYRHSVISLAKHSNTVPNAEGSPDGQYCPVPDLDFVPSYRLRQLIRPHIFKHRLMHMLRDLNADIVHSHTPGYVDCQLQSAQSLQVPFIWTVHGYTNKHKYPLRFRKNISRAISGLNGKDNIVTVVSRTTGEKLASDHPGVIGKYRVIYGGVDTISLRPQLVREAQWYLEHCIPSGSDVVFGTLARLSPEKRLDLMITAFAEFLTQSDMSSVYHLLIAGDGPEKLRLTQLVEELNVAEHIHLIGFQEDISRFLRQIDVFLLTSDAEGFPISVIESMYMGVPVISTDAGGVAEILQEGGGLVVQRNNRKGLVNAMFQAADTGWRSAMSRQAQSISEGYTIERTAEAFAALYEKIPS